MRALANDGATASRQEPACTTPEELAKVVGEMPRIRPPEPTFATPPAYQRTTYQQGTYGRPPMPPGVTQPLAATPPAPLQSRTGKALKWAVSALLIAALGLGSWQLADALMDRDKSGDSGGTSQTDDSGDKNKPPANGPLKIEGAEEYGGGGALQNPADVGKTYDGNGSTYWRTKSFIGGPKLAPYRKGVGIVYDLGSEQNVSAASIALRYGGDHTTVELYATNSLSPSSSVTSMKQIATGTTTDTSLKAKGKEAVKTRYVLVWLTDVPHAPKDQFSSAGYKQAITDVKFTS